MKYTINEDGKIYELPKFSVKISEDMERVENLDSKSIREKLKKRYDFCFKILGKENTEEIIGTFLDADPNIINMVYMDIATAYNSPLQKFEAEKQSEIIDNLNIQQYEELLRFVDRAKPFLQK